MIERSRVSEEWLCDSLHRNKATWKKILWPQCCCVSALLSRERPATTVSPDVVFGNLKLPVPAYRVEGQRRCLGRTLSMEAMTTDICCTRLLPSSTKIVRHRPCWSPSICRRPRTAAAGGSSCSNNVSQEQREELVADLASSLLSDLESFRQELRRSPPRICTLRAFAKEEQVPASSSNQDSVFFRPLAASVQATAQARQFETLSGRFSMIAFATALAVEYVTGNSLFNNMDLKQLANFLVLLVTSLLTITSFAAAWLAKKEISLSMTRGCKDIVDSALNDIVDGLFYDDDDGDGYEA